MGWLNRAGRGIMTAITWQPRNKKLALAYNIGTALLPIPGLGALGTGLKIAKVAMKLKALKIAPKVMKPAMKMTLKPGAKMGTKILPSKSKMLLKQPIERKLMSPGLKRASRMSQRTTVPLVEEDELLEEDLEEEEVEFEEEELEEGEED